MSGAAPGIIVARAVVEAEYRKAWLRAHRTVSAEHDEPLRVVEGAIPPELRGVMYRNGPARFERGGVPYGHLFDGDGMVSSFTFDESGVRYRNRWVRTREHEDEERLSRVVHRSFGTRAPGGFWSNLLRTRFKNAANTSVVYHAGKLLALWEGGLPHRLDPGTLQTLGRDDLGGALLDPPSLRSAIFGRELPFSAHPKIDRRSGHLFNFGLRMGPKPEMVIHRLGADGHLMSQARIALDALWFVHDFALTDRWLVFVLAPVAFRSAPMLFGQLTPAEALAGDATRSLRIMIVSRESFEHGGELDIRMAEGEGIHGFTFHLANAFDDGHDRLVVDAAWTDRFPEFPRPSSPLPDVVPPRLVRFHVDLARLVVRRGECSESLVELPEIDARAQGIDYRMTWGIGARDAHSPILGSIVRLERGAPDHVRDFAPDVIGPPLFVPRPRTRAEDGADGGGFREGDGWLLATLSRAEGTASELLILDATTLETVARAVLPHQLPPGFHGTWVPMADHSEDYNSRL